jgi:hypothetical protein
MDVLKEADLLRLTEITDEWCVSIYMPTHKVGTDQQDSILFKKLITGAEEKLLEYGVRRPEVQRGMRYVQNLLLDSDFWRHQSDGLAIFVAPNLSQIFRLPAQFEELSVIGKKFHLKPLLPMLSEDGQFYILAISLNEVRLFLAAKHTVSEVELVEVPTSLREALFMDDPEKHLSLHTSTNNPGAPGRRPAIFHGQGAQSDEKKKDILRYFQYVDESLSTMIGDTAFPMLLAGVDYLLPIYHEANTCAHILKFGLEGNPDDLGAKELHKRAWKLLEPFFGENERKAREQFIRLHGQKSKLATNDLGTVVKAAHAGAVDTLFVPVDVQHWGQFEAQEHKVVLNQEPGIENEDLFDFAAIHTVLNSGQVFAVKAEALPEKSDVAAILRYPI